MDEELLEKEVENNKGKFQQCKHRNVFKNFGNYLLVYIEKN